MQLDGESRDVVETQEAVSPVPVLPSRRQLCSVSRHSGERGERPVALSSRRSQLSVDDAP